MPVFIGLHWRCLLRVCSYLLRDVGMGGFGSCDLVGVGW